ncbi:hypothetical protein ABH915_001961 [Arthrobacter sp. MW3 TE3886]
MLRTDGHTGKSRTASRSVTAVTGSHCPISGLWALVGGEETYCRVVEGSVMPAFRNTAVQWRLLERLQRGLHR